MGCLIDENIHVHLHMGFIHVISFFLLLFYSSSSSFSLPFFFSIHLHIHNLFAKKMCYFFVLFNEDIIVNLYQIHFSSFRFSS